ncbi:MAG: hypothetical protein ACREUX_13350 [Burkholderiales bacterium]
MGGGGGATGIGFGGSIRGGSIHCTAIGCGNTISGAAAGRKVSAPITAQACRTTAAVTAMRRQDAAVNGMRHSGRIEIGLSAAGWLAIDWLAGGREANRTKAQPHQVNE